MERPATSGACAPAAVRLLRCSGAIGVYEAMLPDGDRCVVKRIDPEAAADDALSLRRFLREIHLAGVLRHPSLPRALAAGEDWIAFEFLDGSLADPAVARRHGDPDAARTLLHALAEVLAYVHARGIVHADIKPKNVMMRGPVPVLIDFGIAGLHSDDPLAGTELVGTPAWMAPEQLAGATPGPEADIWSLSALGLWLLTGTSPYSGDSETILGKRRENAAPEFDLAAAPQCDPALLTMLGQGLGPPGSRPTSAGLARALSAPHPMTRSTAG